MNFNLKFYGALLLRRLPVMMALFLICSGVGLVTALKLPPTYSTTARLLVEPPQIPTSMVASVVQASPIEQLQVIEQRLMTRANLIDIAQKWQIFEDMAEMTPDTIFSEMEANTRIRRTGGLGQAMTMSISFTARSGRTAASVVNDYVTLVLEANSSFRLERVENTLSFFEQETQRLSLALDTKSAEIARFRTENSDALPQDLPYRQGRQTLLQQRLPRLESDRASLLKQRADMIAVFEATGQIGPNMQPQRQLTPEEQQLQQLEIDLENALAVYSETNPRVTVIRNRIRQLNDRIAANAVRVDPAGNTQQPTILDVTLTGIDQRIDAIDTEISTTNAELDQLRVAIAQTASNAIVIDNLDREYTNILAQYNANAGNLNRARLGERIEVTSQGQKITVIENAAVPQNPSGPGRIKITLAGIGAGMGLAAGFFVLLELLNRTIRRPAELNSRFGIVPLATIPYMETARERLWRRAALVAGFVAVLITVPMALYYIDTQFMPLEILANKIIDRLGFG